MAGKNFSVFLFIIIFCGIHHADAFTIGKTYDASNWQEIEDMLPPPVLTWVKKGEWILQTRELDFEWNYEDRYLAATQKNEGRFDLDMEGNLVSKDSGEPVEFFYGTPFPIINPNDPKVAGKIAVNMAAVKYNTGGLSLSFDMMWVGKGGFERSIQAAAWNFPYLNRKAGPIDNPQNFLEQKILAVVAPYDLRGTTTMNWLYNDMREDTAFAYFPMLRRVRRVSAAASSDPFMGSDGCTDDFNTFAGKPASMEWNFLGEKRILAAFISDKKYISSLEPDGSWLKPVFDFNFGYEDPGFRGAPWALLNCIWSPRRVWLIEGIAKDPFYNYGRMILYVDQVAFNSYLKEGYNHAGQYWKSVLSPYFYAELNTGEPLSIGVTATTLMVDDKAMHATTSRDTKTPLTAYDLPLKTLSGDFFTVSNIMQMSK